jgi:hypothetical protein
LVDGLGLEVVGDGRVWTEGRLSGTGARQDGRLLFEASAALEPWEDREAGGDVREDVLCTGGGEYLGVTGSDGEADINEKPTGLGSMSDDC